MTFGEKLYKLRTGRGMSQDVLAELTGVSRQAVSKWERDEAMPDADKIVRLSDVFSVTTDYLLKDGAAADTEREEPPRRVREPDAFDKIGELVKTKWYFLGYALAAWGAIDVVRLIWFELSLGGLFLGGIGNIIGNVVGGSIEMRTIMYSIAQMLYFFIGPAVKLGGGLFIAVWGKKKCTEGW